MASLHGSVTIMVFSPLCAFLYRLYTVLPSGPGLPPQYPLLASPSMQVTLHMESSTTVNLGGQCALSEGTSQWQPEPMAA